MTTPPTPSLVIGLAATRKSGKDTLAAHLAALDPRFERRAFASRLKQDVAPLIREQLGYDPDNLTDEQKEVCRHAWIGWGMACRAKDPLHWVKVVVGDIDHQWAYADRPFFPTVTDVRFCNEEAYLRSHYVRAFRLINLTREGAPPPTDEEEKHFRQVAAMADYHMHWGGDDEAGQRAHAQRLLDWLGVTPLSAQAA